MSAAPSRLCLLRAVLFALIAVSVSLGTQRAHAQIEVNLKLSRRAYILYEPIIATVSITNNAGRDIVLEDDQGTPWLSFDVSQINGSMVPPYETNYEVPPLTIPAGKTLEKKINISPMFPIREQGTHRVRVNLYYSDTGKYFYSNYATFDLTDGRLVWRQSVGAPGGADDVRQVSLLTHQLPDKLLLYVRVRDAEGNNVYTTQSVGRMIITGRMPQEMFDRNNTLHIVHEAVPGTFLYTVVDINGQRLDQKAYLRRGTSRPLLVKGEDGSVTVRGGQLQVVQPVAAGAPNAPKLSDRPAGLPGGAPKQGNGF